MKWYGEPLPSAQALCPKTVELVAVDSRRQRGDVRAAAAGQQLGAHRDPFAGSLRYHLGLVTPNCRRVPIFVDGEPYSWRDGEAVMFDETFIHSAENRTDVTRIILFCDVERPLRTRVMQAVNRFVSRTLIRAARRRTPSRAVGALNRVYALFGPGSDVLTRLKRRNRTVFRAVKYALIASLAYWIFVY